jgi:hypothetical protein
VWPEEGPRDRDSSGHRSGRDPDPDAITDGVDQPTKWSSDTFPYLAEMNGLF